jgi:cytochrome c5
MESSEQEKAILKGFTAPPPSSLDALYPPIARQPIFLTKMKELEVSFVGIVVDLLENDLQNTIVNFEKFKAQYVEVPKLVPEWEKDFPLGPVEELGKALESSNQGKVMEVFDKVVDVCHDCHMLNMVKVQQKFHWKNYRAIKVQDPLTGELVDFQLLMKYVATNFIGITVDVREDQKENAQKMFYGFNARFQAMKDSCVGCHGTEEKKEEYERKYFVDEGVQALVVKLGIALNGSPIDPKAVETLSQAIGMESCSRCHLVHVPAAEIKHQWEKWEKIKGN